MKDPGKLLNSVLLLIAKDVRHIKKAARKGKLEHETALDLTRYSKALLDIVADQDNRKKVAKTRVAHLTTEELKAMAAELAKKDSAE